MTVNERIKDLAAMRGWSQYQLSKESGLSMSTISNIYTRGNTPSFATLEILCDAFHMTLSEFFSYETEEVALSYRGKIMLEYFVKLNELQQDRLIDFMKTI